MLFIYASDKSTSNTCWLFYYQRIRINCWTGCFTTFHIKPRLVPIAPSSSKLLWIKLQLVIPRRVLQFNKLWTRTSFNLYFVFDAKTIKNGIVSFKKKLRWSLLQILCMSIALKGCLTLLRWFLYSAIYWARGLTGIGGGVGLAGVHDWMVDTCWAAPPDSARLRHTRQSPHTTHPPSRTSTTTRSQTLNTGVQCLETSNCDINVYLYT